MISHAAFQCQLITPEAILLDTQADLVVLPAHDGEIGILRDRAPLLCKLGIGELRLNREQQTVRYFVDGGFAHVADNHVVVLTQKAVPADKIDIAEAEKDLAEALARKTHTPEEVEQRNAAVQRSRTKIKVAGKK